MRASPAAKVAAVATAVIAGVYIIGVVVLNLVVARHLTEQNDERLAAHLTAARQYPAALSQPGARPGPAASPSSPPEAGGDIDADGAPVFLWSADARGTVTGLSAGEPALRPAVLAAHALREGLAVTADLGGASPFRLKLTRYGSGWLIAGQSLAGDAHTRRLLLNAEVIAGPFLLLAMFLGSLIVGLRALAPVEQSRRRQLEFTADASHELRTPLSVIRAEADVALSAPREASEYRDALTRIQGESSRLRQLVDDMLWLARFDSRPPPPGDEPVDLTTLARACADRFRAVGPAVSAQTPDGAVLISAPPEWIDRLAGVLVDNACRHAGPDGTVRIRVRAQGSRVSLTVEDSGPGIPAADRPRLFDRFHRATQEGYGGMGPSQGGSGGMGPSQGGSGGMGPSQGGSGGMGPPGGSSGGFRRVAPPGQHGAGLGLAIGDSIVRSTGGRWHVGDSPLGGALMSVSWRHSQPHRTATPRLTATNVKADGA